MNIHRSLAEANLYRAVALIPEQAAFGLALAGSNERHNPETRRNLELGRRFCELLLDVAQHREHVPASEQEAAIVFGLKEIDENLVDWSPRMEFVKGVVESLLAGEQAKPDVLARSGRILREFASVARQNVAMANESELLRRVWV